MRNELECKKIRRIMVCLVLILSVLMSGLEKYNLTIPVVYGEETKENQTIYEGEGVKITCNVESQWGDGYIGAVTITNTSDSTIENWEISYESSDEYSNIWNASITYRSARIYHIKNAGHNQNIKPKESVSFGFQASFHNQIDLPKSYSFLGEEMEIDEGTGNVTYNIRDKWNNGCIIDVTIHNTSEETIEDWALDFEYPHKIDNIWRAKIESQEGNTYHLKNCEYNSVIAPGSDETFGMQIGFSAGEDPGVLSNIVLSQKKKEVNYVEFDKEWNRLMVQADSAEVKKAVKNHPYTVNVALIDSGIDYMEGINVVDSENFVEEYDETNPLFDDILGHGTAVAGLMAYNDELEEDEDGDISDSLTNETIKGVNPYINIYSARVLDDKNETTIERLIAGIEWAIDKNVNIININCGVSKDNKALHNVIKKAYDKGILLIAAAGNESEVQYPAKYNEVMAVGSLKCNGEKAKSSASGDTLEIVAPGEDVTSYGAFGVLDCYSGSSMAAPQVTALASILWQQDLTKSNEFIRQLIDISANPLGDRAIYGYGVIDCKNALEQYDEFSRWFSEKNTMEENIDETLEQNKIQSNTTELVCVDEESVKGYWGKDEHKDMVDKKMRVIRRGAQWPDKKASKVKGKVDFPQFHGYYETSSKLKVNYIEAYIFMTKVASNLYSKSWDKLSNKEKKKYSDKTDFENKEIWLIGGDGDCNSLAENLKKAAKAGFQEYNYSTAEQKSNFVYGIALHTVADIFAHSTYAIPMKDSKRKEEYEGDKSLEELVKTWKYLSHGPKDENGHFNPEKNFADMKKCISMRYSKSAKLVCNEILNEVIITKTVKIKNEKGKTVTKKKVQHKIGSSDVFLKVKYYSDKKNKDAWKYDDLKKKDGETDKKYNERIFNLKRKYVIYSYGIKNFLKYAEDTDQSKKKDLVTLAEKVDCDSIKDLFNSWVKAEKEKKGEVK